MSRILSFFLCFSALIIGDAFAISGISNISDVSTNTSDYVSPSTYENLYPYMNNKMRVRLNPGVTPSLSESSTAISAYTKTNGINESGRRVVSRAATNPTVSSARSGTISSNGNTARRVVSRGNTITSGGNTARSAINNNSAVSARAGAISANGTAARRVVSRGTSEQRSTTRADASYRGGIATNSGIDQSTKTITTDQCLADYTTCMDSYCERENTNYNRCYCSSKLAQIDSEYQTDITNLLKQILELQNGGSTYTEAEMNAYWIEKIGQYTGDNSWTNIDEDLDIDWSNTESRVRGQQAFLTGHEYCSQHLRACYYMASNLRDAYRSNIARDCATYESKLGKIKTAAESVIENFSD